jgi:hypothetical protein
MTLFRTRFAAETDASHELSIRECAHHKVVAARREALAERLHRCGAMLLDR